MKTRTLCPVAAVLTLALSICTSAGFARDGQAADFKTSSNKQRFQVLFAQQNWPEAIHLADSLLKSNPLNVDALFYRAYAESYNRRTLDKALKDINEACELNSKDGRCFWWKSAILHMQQEDEEALPIAEKACTLMPSSPDAPATKAEILNGLRRPEEALKSIERAVQLAPKNASVYRIKAEIFQSLGRSLEAEQQLNQALTLDRFDNAARSARVSVCARLKKWSQVVDDCTILIDSNGGSTKYALEKRANAFVELKKYDKAIADLNALVARSPQDRRFHAQLARIYELTGNMAKAQAETQWVKQIDADVPPL